jgi:hypothetical protein
VTQSWCQIQLTITYAAVGPDEVVAALLIGTRRPQA